MKTLTRNSAAKNLGITSNHLLYWEERGELQPEKVKVGSSALVIYDEKLLEKARKIFGRRKKKE